ncbi:MAG TPA: S-methyl-5'-thioinosine phosphorylase [Woeseiaceae bacterium]|nr:S-methyl-5'-thioinosine phosphorylase [Woeseiaceae bacterium]
MPERHAVILGSGFSDYVAHSPSEQRGTPYGDPSGAIHTLTIGGQQVFGLLRHGAGHVIPAHAVNYRANIAALAELKVRAIIAFNTVGVIGAAGECGHLALPDQLLDYTWGREQTYFTGSAAGVRHLDFTEPFAEALREQLLTAASRAGIRCKNGGVYAVTQGPRLETAAEVDRLERDGASFIGMTAMPEAILAAELDIAYVCLALIVNQAAGRGSKPIHDDVEANTASARTEALALVESFFAG